MWEGVDLGTEVLNAGGAAAFLARGITLREMPELAFAVDQQRKALHEASLGITDHSNAVRAVAGTQLRAAHERLNDASNRAAQAVSEYEVRRARLQDVADAFAEHRTACGEEEAVIKCRVIADAYVNVLRTLQQHHEKGNGGSNVDTVAANIDILIREVEAVRCAGPKSLFGESLAVNKRILLSIENRCVDSVIKARAAFVNVMDNEFRSFGWPMKVPKQTENDDMIALVNFYVTQLSKLQKVAQRSNFVAQRTNWHRALSDSWAMAAILRAPLARFKYHFLENYRPNSSSNDESTISGSALLQADLSGQTPDGALTATTRRFDRPEWAAEFALERIWEAASFLKQIVLDDTCTADLKFAEGFCKVFANKMAYDCDLAVRTADDERSADRLISHTAETAAAFDTRLREGLLSRNPIYSASDRMPLALDILSSDERFLSNWALAEQRLAHTDVLKRLDALLLRKVFDSEGVGRDLPTTHHDSAGGELDLELECAEIVERISQSSRGCRTLGSKLLMLRFVKWTELHLLEAVRVRLQEELTVCNWEPKSAEAVYISARAAWVAHSLAVALEDRCCDAFYVALEHAEDNPFRGKANGGTGTNGVAAVSPEAVFEANPSSVYSVEIDRLRMLSGKACDSIAASIEDEFTMKVAEEYRGLVRFGELPAPDAAVVLEHDVSETLCGCMAGLDAHLSAVNEAISNRKMAALVWRPIAERLDSYFFEEIVLQSFTGGQRNAVSAASSANDYMVSASAAKMARQIAYDASVLVQIFGRVTGTPDLFLGRCSDARKLLLAASTRVLRPRAPVRQHDDELLAVALATEVVVDGDDAAAEAARLRKQAGVERLSAREARECVIVGGMYDALPLD